MPTDDRRGLASRERGACAWKISHGVQSFANPAKPARDSVRHPECYGISLQPRDPLKIQCASAPHEIVVGKTCVS